MGVELRLLAISFCSRVSHYFSASPALIFSSVFYPFSAVLSPRSIIQFSLLQPSLLPLLLPHTRTSEPFAPLCLAENKPANPLYSLIAVRQAASAPTDADILNYALTLG